MPDTTEIPASSEAPVTPEAADTSLTGGVIPASTKLTDVPAHEVKPTEEYDFDKRLYTEDGKFNKDGAKEFLSEAKAEKERYEKRILDLRRKVSDGKAPEKAEEYFQDYAPPERFMGLFDPKAESAPEIKKITEGLSKMYHDSGLSKRQADDVSNTFLTILESLDVVDTKTEEQKIVEKQKWVNEQKRQLGSNADNLIRETRVFVENSPAFSASTKNTLIEMMETIGAPFIETLHQLKDAYGSNTGGVPVNIANLSGLPSDIELKQEYLAAGTSDLRKQEIIALRAKAGRSGKLMDATI